MWKYVPTYKLRKFVRIVRAEIIPCLALTPDLTGSALVDSGFYHAILERITQERAIRRFEDRFSR